MAIRAVYPAPFIEPAAETLTDMLISEARRPVDISTIAPQVAAVTPLTQAAQQRTATQAGLGTLQFDPTTGEVTGAGAGTGVAAYEPFVQQAQQDLASARGMTSPTAYQQFMSPYQQEVIDATEQLLAEQRAAGRAGQAADAIAAGAFGGGREGVRRAEYERQRDIYDAAQLAQLRQAGFQQAVGQAQQAGTSLQNLAARQAGLGQTQQTLEAGITGQLGRTGTGAQSFSQALLEAQRQGNVLGLEYPLARLESITRPFGTLVSGAPSYGQPTQPILTNPALAGIQGLAGTYGLAAGPSQAASQGLGSFGQRFM
tara:strand:+ start:14651 stop:15592 length:942 start_codon:yes stop_codon:yes gene_type:complete